MESNYEGIVVITTTCNGNVSICDLGKDIYLPDDEFRNSMRKVATVQ